MKSDKTNVDKILDRAVTRHANLSQQKVDSALDRAWENLQPEIARAQDWHRENPRNSSHASTLSAGRGYLWGAAAAVFAVVLLSVVIRYNPSPAVISSIDGPVQLISGSESRSIHAGDGVGYGELVRSSSGAVAVLALRDRSQVEMRSNSEVVLEPADDGVRIRLNGGGVLVTAAKQRKGHLYVQTKDVIVSVVGTVFSVNVEEAGSRVAVVQGEVFVTQVHEGVKARRLLAGEQMVTNPSVETRPVVEQVAIAQTISAPLQQSKRVEFEVTVLRPGDSSAPVEPRLRCRGIDGELNPPIGDAPAAPLGRCVGGSIPLAALILNAYRVQYRLIAGLPNLMDQPRYQIDAKAEDPSKTTKEDLRQMLQSLLADRLKLKVHRETRQMDGHILKVAKTGVKFTETSGDEEQPQSRPGPPPPASVVRMIPMAAKGKFGLWWFAEYLSLMSRQPVIDRTGLPGVYDISLALNLLPPTPESNIQEFEPSLSSALENQLGLTLESGKVPVEYLIVDHYEKAPPN